MTPARRWIAAVLAIAAVVAIVLAFTGDPSATGAEPAPAGATPLWSPRRVPQPIVAAVGAQRLQGALDTEMGGDGVCYEVENGGGPVASHGADVPLIPASAQKLFVAAAALDDLGPDFTYVTKAVAPQRADNGTVPQLTLVGSGDPGLVTDDYVAFLATQPRLKTDVFTHLEALADAIVAAGVQRIPGGIVADDSRYDTQRQVDGWKPSYRADGDVGSLGALVVNGGYSSFTPRRPADDPALDAAAHLTDVLRAKGVQVGEPTRGSAPADAVEIANVASPPLHDVVGAMLTNSGDLTAEVLAKELAVHANQPGTTAAGLAAVVTALQRLGVPIDGMQLLDASGLHRGDRTTCRTLLATLDLGSQPKFATLWDGLSVAGQKGTLVNQILGLGLEGKLHAKTGTLDGVSSLVGKIDGSQQVHFAYIDNGSTGYGAAVADSLRRDLAAVLTTFPDAPSADELVPAPQ
ncbi:MAG TPA: D-alanyl-D-alanine carboxypeptidase/D-alanyl-D-alanine-endopeptidase [Acidimicrobiia bacterium]|nr:D-alanyl-D-alanine carboxypeptidase/D-alanyl-D-alanine-endopeptidase [Acidimicrobiia bacterium]